MHQDTSNNYELIFVYGTLRNGCSNHRLIAHAECLGQGRSQRSFSLYLGDFPYAVSQEATGPIRGEVYRVNQDTRLQVDLLEGHPHWYCRQKETICLDSGELVQAWIYFFPEPRGRLVPSGDFLDAE